MSFETDSETTALVLAREEPATAPARWGAKLRAVSEQALTDRWRRGLDALFLLDRDSTLRVRSMSTDETAAWLEVLRASGSSRRRPRSRTRDQLFHEVVTQTLLALRERSVIVPHEVLSGVESVGIAVPSRVWTSSVEGARKSVARGIRALFLQSNGGPVLRMRTPSLDEIESTVFSLLDLHTPDGHRDRRVQLFGATVESELLALQKAGVALEPDALEIFSDALAPEDADFH